MSLNPKDWSAKAQSLAVALVPVIVAALNAWLGWHLDPMILTGLFTGGGVGAAAVAVIDHGERPDAPAPATKPVPTPEEAAILAKFGVPVR